MSGGLRRYLVYGGGWFELGFSGDDAAPDLVARGIYQLQASARRGASVGLLMAPFGLLIQFRSTGLLSMSVNDFDMAMEAPPSCIKDFGQLPRRIVPAVEELVTKNDRIIN